MTSVFFMITADGRWKACLAKYITKPFTVVIYLFCQLLTNGIPYVGLVKTRRIQCERGRTRILGQNLRTDADSKFLDPHVSGRRRYSRAASSTEWVRTAQITTLTNVSATSDAAV